MKKSAMVGLVAILGACSAGGGISGKYVSTVDGNTTMEFTGDNATVSSAGMSMSGPAKKSPGSVDVTIGEQTKTFKVDDKGCLVNAEIGTLCKK